MNRIPRLTLIALLMAGSVVLPALAKDDKPKREDRPTFGAGPLLSPRLVEQLKLTAAQRAEYDRLQTQWNDARERHRAQHQQRMQELRRERRAARDAGNEARVREIRDEMGKIMRPQMELRQQLIQQFRATLTPEQQSILDTARERVRQRFEDRRDERRGKRD